MAKVKQTSHNHDKQREGGLCSVSAMDNELSLSLGASLYDDIHMCWLCRQSWGVSACSGGALGKQGKSTVRLDRKMVGIWFDR